MENRMIWTEQPGMAPQLNDVALEKEVERFAEATFNPQKPWGEFKAYKRDLIAFIRGRVA
jgi:hypothetical protein